MFTPGGGGGTPERRLASLPGDPFDNVVGIFKLSIEVGIKSTLRVEFTSEFMSEFVLEFTSSSNL